MRPGHLGTLTDVNWREPPFAGEKREEGLNCYEDKKRKTTMKSRIALRPILAHSGHTKFSEENEWRVCSSLGALDGRCSVLLRV